METDNDQNEHCAPMGHKSLRNEIVEFQKARMDLLKFKAVAVAALGAIGLGFSVQPGSTGTSSGIQIHPAYVLCVIPFVCLYVDLVCYHNTLRILVIARYLESHGCLYEKFISQLDASLKNLKKGVRYFFEFEDLALAWSSIGLSILLIVYGFFCFFPKEVTIFKILLTIGIAGTFLSWVAKQSYENHVKTLFATPVVVKGHSENQ
ncbi:MAG: hypothetical protein HY912_24780 [Desulfomonile tiedjei]|uniref:Uncharacterized protein n=1 Tax=Desulfomonile tiedjei TaxID=2358 RepID=A0A9D6V705_9BACT|nr:hypothetical protein [Desulfomonile tiedjei]